MATKTGLTVPQRFSSLLYNFVLSDFCTYEFNGRVVLARNCCSSQFGRPAGVPAGTQKTAFGTKFPTPSWHQYFHGGSTLKLYGWQSHLLKTVGGANLEGLPGCQWSWPRKTASGTKCPKCTKQKIQGWQSHLLKRIGGDILEGLLGCQLRWHPKNCNWH